ncbi:MAG: hypothetical protein MHM6MM_002071 [Cercozoa sp. M6MM]
MSGSEQDDIFPEWKDYLGTLSLDWQLLSFPSLAFPVKSDQYAALYTKHVIHVTATHLVETERFREKRRFDLSTLSRVRAIGQDKIAFLVDGRRSDKVQLLTQMDRDECFSALSSIVHDLTVSRRARRMDHLKPSASGVLELHRGMVEFENQIDDDDDDGSGSSSSSKLRRVKKMKPKRRFAKVQPGRVLIYKTESSPLPYSIITLRNCEIAVRSTTSFDLFSPRGKLTFKAVNGFADALKWVRAYRLAMAVSRFQQRRSMEQWRYDKSLIDGAIEVFNLSGRSPAPSPQRPARTLDTLKVDTTSAALSRHSSASSLSGINPGAETCVNEEDEDRHGAIVGVMSPRGNKQFALLRPSGLCLWLGESDTATSLFSVQQGLASLLEHPVRRLRTISKQYTSFVQSVKQHLDVSRLFLVDSHAQTSHAQIEFCAPQFETQRFAVGRLAVLRLGYFDVSNSLHYENVVDAAATPEAMAKELMQTSPAFPEDMALRDVLVRDSLTLLQNLALAQHLHENASKIQLGTHLRFADVVAAMRESAHTNGDNDVKNARMMEDLREVAYLVCPSQAQIDAFLDNCMEDDDKDCRLLLDNAALLLLIMRFVDRRIALLRQVFEVLLSARKSSKASQKTQLEEASNAAAAELDVLSRLSSSMPTHDVLRDLVRVCVDNAAGSADTAEADGITVAQRTQSVEHAVHSLEERRRLKAP